MIKQGLATTWVFMKGHIFSQFRETGERLLVLLVFCFFFWLKFQLFQIDFMIHHILVLASNSNLGYHLQDNCWILNNGTLNG